MANIRGYSLALFGQIDQEAIDADKDPSPMNDAVLATIEGFLPNSTGLGQRGWFHELEDFFNSPRIREPRSVPFTFPTYEEAKEQLGGIQPVDRSSFDFEPLDDDCHPALARAVYAQVVLDKIRATKNSFSPPQPIAPDNQLFAMLPGILDPWPVEKEGRVFTPDAKVEAFVARLDEMVDRDSFVRIARDEISPEFAEQCKPCFGTLEDSGGEYCSTLYTDSKDPDLTVDDIKKIIHPLNWDLCCPTFFHKMTEQLPGRFTTDGWFRIVESISAEPDEYLLQTALVFSLDEREAVPGTQEGNSKGIIINYKLDSNRSGEGLSAGIVEIDNGYLWVTPTGEGPGGKGVRIRTSKEERVNGLSPTATAALGCLLGWADAGKEMLAGAARKAMNNKLPLPAGRTLQGWPSSALKLTPLDQDPPTVPPDVPARLPINFDDTVNDTATLAKSLVGKMASNLGDALSRWMDGLVRGDVEEITDEIGRDLKKWSLEVYNTAERNVKPPPGGAING
jgi:hypothetical protein